MYSASNEVIKIYLCDDNGANLQTLSKTVCTLTDDYQIQLRQFTSPAKLLERLESASANKEKGPDLILIDIEMPEMDGITLGKKLKRISPDLRLVFVTAYAEYAMKGYEANAFRYLLKPVSAGDIRKLISDIFAENALQKKIMIKSGEGEILLPVRDIIYISAEDKYTIVYTQNNYYITDESLKYYEGKLVPLGFFRIHRKYLINMYYHKSVSGNKLLLSHGIELPLSRRRNEAYKRKLFHFMKDDLV